jgi:hypothetical protein
MPLGLASRAVEKFCENADVSRFADVNALY